MKKSLNDTQKKIVMDLVQDAITGYFERAAEANLDIKETLTTGYRVLNHIYQATDTSLFDLIIQGIKVKNGVKERDSNFSLLDGFKRVNTLLHDYATFEQLNLHKLGTIDKKTAIGGAHELASDLVFNFMSDLYSLKEKKNITPAEMQKSLSLLLEGLQFDSPKNYLNFDSMFSTPALGK